MCGICGIVDWKNHLSTDKRQTTVANMNQAIIHRGPDGAGMHSNEFSTIAMRRLSIIDYTGGQQPIFNETKDVYVFFNGEIYNYLALKEPLIAKGHRFSTVSDTEVLVHLYEEYGVEMLTMLKGMFSFCLVDLKKNSYFLARDRFGEKPLYYHFVNNVFSFSSEIKSLLENKNIDRQLNEAALPYYFRTSLVPEPITLFKNIKSLQAGHYMVFNEKGIKEKPYFKINYQKRKEINREEEAIEYIQPVLENAVLRQSVSDVPIGAFLSGGIDSSTVVALLQSQTSQPIKTFNVRFEDQAYDESSIARKVAKYCGTDHQEILVPNVDFDEKMFWEIIDHVGLPFRDSSAIPSYLVSKEIAKHVKVALSGDGGDELFGGYDLFQWYQKIIRLKNLAQPIRSLANSSLSLAQSTPGFKNNSLIRKLKRGISTSFQSVDEIPIALNEMFTNNEVQEILTTSSSKIFKNESNYVDLKNYPADSGKWSDLRKIMYYRLHHTLPANMLIKVDRMSMANSLEVRAPFLDPDLFEASVQLPDHLLVHGKTGKYLLRKIMKDQLPEEVFSHPKMGFSIPLHKYQNEAFKNLAKRLLFDENPWPNYFDKKLLKQIYHKGISTLRDTAKESVFKSAHQLWMMMQLLGWAKRFKVKI